MTQYDAIIIGGAITVDMKKLKARKDEISGKSNKGVKGWFKAHTLFALVMRYSKATKNLSMVAGGLLFHRLMD